MDSKHTPENGLSEAPRVVDDWTDHASVIGRLVVDAGGTLWGELSNVTTMDVDGAEITGNGTLQYPLTVRLSPVRAAAPELLAALTEAIRSLEIDGPASAAAYLRTAGRAAIAKATGRA